MDDLLAQLKAEFEPTQQSRANAKKPQARKSRQPPQSTSSASMDQMLAELRAELEAGRGRPNATPEKPQPDSKPNQTAAVNSNKYRFRLNALIEEDYRKQAQKREAKFAEIKRQEEARIAAEKRRQQELIEAQKREELRQRRRKEALREKAQQWLKNLNPRSEEGKWFEEFSYSYENKLQAAIDYLEAMRESGL